MRLDPAPEAALTLGGEPEATRQQDDAAHHQPDECRSGQAVGNCRDQATWSLSYDVARPGKRAYQGRTRSVATGDQPYDVAGAGRGEIRELPGARELVAQGGVRLRKLTG